MDDEIKSTLEQLNTFRIQDECRINCFEKLANALHDARSKCELLEGDMKSEQTSRRHLQQQVHDLEGKLSSLQKRVKNSAFVLVLLDADYDGYVFRDHYINRCAEGGKDAAQEFQRNIRLSLNINGFDENVPVMVRAFANVEGLSNTLRDAGVISSSEKMTRFIQGFNRAKFCDFVSVGSGKERADEKIKALFGHACVDPSCLEVVLGVCHDNGYARMLEQVYEPEILARITLLKTIRIGHDFKALNLKHVIVDGLFRTEPLKSVAPPSAASETRFPNSNTPSPINAICPKPGTYAQVASDSNGTKSPSLSVANEPSGCVKFNSLGQRVDGKLPPGDQKAHLSYKEKLKQGKRYCKPHFLTGQCPFSPCLFEHKGLNPQEIEVCRAEMRQRPCKGSVHCADPDCFYGHHCPRGDCTGESCRLGFSVEMHDGFGH